LRAVSPSRPSSVGTVFDATSRIAPWRGRRYANKQVGAIAVEENGWLVITVMVRFF
jgi:hypothetical protein